MGRKIIILFIFIGISNLCNAQTESFFDGVVRGKVIDDSTMKAIPRANIFNESQRILDYSLDDGEFIISAEKGDTLVFSAIGYYSAVVIVTELMLKKKKIFGLSSQVYELDEVTVKALLPYEQFKKQILNLQVERSFEDSLGEELTEESLKVAKIAERKRMEREIMSRPKGDVFTLRLPVLKKESKQRKKFKKKMAQQEKQKIINSKYNRDLIKEITKLSDNEITIFMGFCNFSTEFLYQASEYEIVQKIYEKYELYKEQQGFVP